MKKSILFLVAYLFFSMVSAFADQPAEQSENQPVDLVQLKAEADSAYTKENYEEALQKYALIADSVRDARLFYNLGCCYYRLDDMARSVLWFERAYLLNPGDHDIRFNLDMARSKTIDRITPRHEMFFVALYRQIVNLMSLQQWAVVCIVIFMLVLLSLGLFFFSKHYSLRKAGFYLSILFIILTVFGNVCAFQQKSFLRNRRSGIIMSPAVTVKSTPSENGNDLFVLHEGTKVYINDNEMKDWCEIKIADGKVGWIQRKEMELI